MAQGGGETFICPHRWTGLVIERELGNSNTVSRKVKKKTLLIIWGILNLSESENWWYKQVPEEYFRTALSEAVWKIWLSEPEYVEMQTLYFNLSRFPENLILISAPQAQLHKLGQDFVRSHRATTPCVGSV